MTDSAEEELNSSSQLSVSYVILINLDAESASDQVSWSFFLSFILDSRLYFIPRPTCYSVWESSALGPRGPESSPMTRCYKQKHHFQEGRYKRVRKHPTQCRSILCMDPSLYAIRCRILAVWKRSVGYHWLRQLDSLEHAHLCRSPLSRFHHLQSIQVCPSFPIIS